MEWRHRISKEVAENIVRIIHEATGHNVNVMGEGGEIIATMQPHRLGTIHEGGRRVVSGEEDYVSLTSEQAATMEGVLAGYMGAIDMDGERIGCMGITGEPDQVKPLQKMASYIVVEQLRKEKVQKAKQLMLNKVADKIQGASSNIQEVAAGAEEIATTSRNMEATAKQIEDYINDINRVLDLVGSIVKQTNLLGLNAAIEAARAGEYGRGFSIVAEEVRKLSANSASSLQDINKVLHDTKSSINGIVNGIEKNAVTTEQQAVALQTVGEKIMEIESEVTELVQQDG
ncbi:Methyl-accepting chemotaxis protein 3 [Sporomusa ovata DSM 2662]|uniref:Methyl-accepting chemotaxis protein n=1 Tax=Sporomusa ovata TaxID=2378 RepID=A0A0U1KSF4_9FIRM|nr:methyl-accepting chemotaxis protein [Sporomusa ovata]EQB26266.1 methyl-accepting chemotaxis sensory transducer [Sporomusa ovata DSM 2662]CQR70342.1 Methyl-accepting chemotaxis protein [Sporomusa ovata]